MVPKSKLKLYVEFDTSQRPTIRPPTLLYMRWLHLVSFRCLLGSIVEV